MTKQLRRQLSAWAAALLFAALALGVFIPAAAAHNATKNVTRERTECSYEYRMVEVVTWKASGKAGALNRHTSYKQELVRVCKKVPYTVTIGRPHLHVTERVCTYVTLAGGAVGAAAGAPGVGTAAAGGAIGGAIGYESCQLLPSIIWLG